MGKFKVMICLVLCISSLSLSVLAIDDINVPTPINTTETRAPRWWPGVRVAGLTTFLAKGSFSLKTFGITFGLEYIYEYGACLWRNNVR